MHTHAGNGIQPFIASIPLTSSPPTMPLPSLPSMSTFRPFAIFDVDDPPSLSWLIAQPDHIVAIPMNDNQTNTRTALGAAH